MKPEGEIQSFYERMPYPAPVNSLDKHLTQLRHPERRRIRSLLLFPEGKPHGPQNILVAGCGTSQAAKIALREPDACVTAIDISSTSLRHQAALRRKYALNNLTLRQLSILEVAALDLCFDQIICTGVLHHLPDPDLGLRCLHDVLKPDGAMQIMVYARYGRTGIYMLQAYCRLLGIAPSELELDALGATLKCLPDDHPLAGLLHKCKDFLHPDAMADALLHPQDRAYTVPEVREWLQRCGMHFGRWLEQAPYLPHCGAVAQTPHAARLKTLDEPAQHAAVELFRGTMTQHAFVAYRNDRTRSAQPIRFDGENWKNYIPIRFPWAMTVRERLPPGSVGVLLNPVHKHSDLVLPVSVAENRLLSEIDGVRTLGEMAAGPNGAAGLVPQFFEKLWRYDQIVLDANRIMN